MGKQIQIMSLDEMQRAAQKLKSISENYAELAARLINEAKTMQAAWDGADNQAFTDQISGFSSDLQTMSGRLMAAGHTIERQRANYLARQEANMTAVRKLIN